MKLFLFSDVHADERACRALVERGDAMLEELKKIRAQLEKNGQG